MQVNNRQLKSMVLKNALSPFGFSVLPDWPLFAREILKIEENLEIKGGINVHGTCLNGTSVRERSASHQLTSSFHSSAKT